MAETHRTHRLLDVVQTLPYPQRSGSDLRTWHLCRRLAEDFEVTMLSRTLAPLTGEQRRVCADARITLENLHIPRPGLATKVVKGLQFLFSRYPVSCAGWAFRSMRRRLGQLLDRGRFDLTMIESSMLAWYWPFILRGPGAHVLVLQNLEAELLQSQAALLPAGWRRALLLFDAWRLQRVQDSMVRTADCTILTSQLDRDLLLQRHPGIRTEVVRNGVDLEERPMLPFREGHKMLYVGSLRYPPNVDAVRHFATSILPLILKRHPAAVFEVIGRSPGSGLRDVASMPGVRLVGEVDDVVEHYRAARVCVVPLRVGGGTRLKIVEAMSCGRPVVSTAKGAEGLGATDGVELLLAEEPEAFALAIGRIFDGPALADGLVKRARAFVEANYDWDSIAEHCRAVCADIVAVSRRAPAR
jgi:glycosyltransferase involved in cell wall biosynthesis